MHITVDIVQNLTYSSIIINICSSDYPILTLLTIFPGVFRLVSQSPVKVIQFIRNNDNKTEIGNLLRQKKLHNDWRILVLKRSVNLENKKNLPWLLRYKVCQ